MGLFGKLFGQKQSNHDFHTEFGPEFVLRLATSAGLQEWTAGAGLQHYTDEEQEAIEDTRQSFAQMTDSIAREKGGEHMAFHPDLSEPLKRALCEAGLSNYAWRAFPVAMDGHRVPTECPVNWREIASAYVKCYFCNRSPFALLRLAQLLAVCGHQREAADAVHAVLAFPKYARSHRPPEMDLVAAMSTSYLFSDVDFAGLYSRGGFSEASLAQLVREAQALTKSVPAQTSL